MRRQALRLEGDHPPICHPAADGMRHPLVEPAFVFRDERPPRRRRQPRLAALGREIGGGNCAGIDDPQHRRFRLDTTTANSHAGVVSEEGLLQFGHSKDNDDLPQLKVAAAVLDPLGMPVATLVVPGNSADDPLYVPLAQQVQQAFGKGGKTYVGDCKMAALATRAYLVSTADYYLCPLSEKQFSREQRLELIRRVRQGQQTVQPVYRPKGDPAEAPSK